MTNIHLMIDVESVGLHGLAYAVGYVLIDSDGKVYDEGIYAMAPESLVRSDDPDLKWVQENCPKLTYTHLQWNELLVSFWNKWIEIKTAYPNVKMWADCAWPVEANFLSACMLFASKSSFDGPYPLYDVSTLLLSRNEDPVGIFSRDETELPKHNPLCDARQSARILLEHL